MAVAGALEDAEPRIVWAAGPEAGAALEARQRIPGRPDDDVEPVGMPGELRAGELGNEGVVQFHPKRQPARGRLLTAMVGVSK